MLRAVFYLADRNILSLPEAARLCTLNPAKAVKISEYTGSVEVGKAADLIIVTRNTKNEPMLKSVFVDGINAMQLNYGEGK